MMYHVTWLPPGNKTFATTMHINNQGRNKRHHVLYISYPHRQTLQKYDIYF